MIVTIIHQNIKKEVYCLGDYGNVTHGCQAVLIIISQKRRKNVNNQKLFRKQEMGTGSRKIKYDRFRFKSWES